MLPEIYQSGSNNDIAYWGHFDGAIDSAIVPADGLLNQAAFSDEAIKGEAGVAGIAIGGHDGLYMNCTGEGNHSEDTDSTSDNATDMEELDQEDLDVVDRYDD